MLRLLSLAVFLFTWWAASLMAGEQMLPAPATVLGANGLTLTGTVTVAFNDTGRALSETLTLPASTAPGASSARSATAACAASSTTGGAPA